MIASISFRLIPVCLDPSIGNVQSEAETTHARPPMHDVHAR